MTAGDPPSAGAGPRTYIRRRGRLTRAQARALDTLSADYLLAPSALCAGVSEHFERPGPLGLEIGFGMGHALLDWARQRPAWNLVGVEIYEPGVGAALLGLEREALGNVRLVQAPVELVLECLPAGSLEEVRIFFPDPWPKARHHKRRLLQPDFIRLVTGRMAEGALLWIATDWEDYADSIIRVLDAEPGLAPAAESGPDPTFHARPRTRFEARGIRLGHRVWDLRYRRNASSTESR
jgi:tRNA (guanine-N7-)-methyltransferase